MVLAVRPAQRSDGEEAACSLSFRAPQRVALVLSLITSFQVMRQNDWPLGPGRVEPKALVKILGPVFQQLVEGEQPHGNELPKRDLTLPSKPRLYYTSWW